MKYRETKYSANITWAALLFVESVFGYPCWVQCISFVSEGHVAGGSDLCAFQGWYTGICLYSWPLIVGLLCLLTKELKAEQSEKQTPKETFLQRWLPQLLVGSIAWG